MTDDEPTAAPSPPLTETDDDPVLAAMRRAKPMSPEDRATCLALLDETKDDTRPSMTSSEFAAKLAEQPGYGPGEPGEALLAVLARIPDGPPATPKEQRAFAEVEAAVTNARAVRADEAAVLAALARLPVGRPLTAKERQRVEEVEAARARGEAILGCSSEELMAKARALHAALDAHMAPVTDERTRDVIGQVAAKAAREVRRSGGAAAYALENFPGHRARADELLSRPMTPVEATALAGCVRTRLELID